MVCSSDLLFVMEAAQIAVSCNDDATPMPRSGYCLKQLVYILKQVATAEFGERALPAIVQIVAGFTFFFGANCLEGHGLEGASAGEVNSGGGTEAGRREIACREVHGALARRGRGILVAARRRAGAGTKVRCAG